MAAHVSGYVKTNADGERYIDAETIAENGTGSVAPINVINRALGGGNWLYNGSTGAGQEGVQGGKGLNNIGLFVHVWGEVTRKTADYFYIDDGSHLGDGTQTNQVDNVGVRVLGHLVGYGPGDYLGVVGVSSCFRTAGGPRRLVRLPGEEDVYDLLHGAGTVATPAISPVGGEYLGTVQAVLGCATPGAAIRYTVDGMDPTETSALYDPDGVVVVPHSLTVRAKAFKPGWDPSAVRSAAYSIVPSQPRQYSYQVNETQIGPSISGLRVTDVFKPNSVRLQWSGGQPRYEVQRCENNVWTELTNNATEQYFVDTQCPLVPGAAYGYLVRGHGGENQDKGLPQPPHVPRPAATSCP